MGVINALVTMHNNDTIILNSLLVICVQPQFVLLSRICLFIFQKC